MRRAFTLIEALVVILLIGLLAALGVPKVGTILQDSRVQAATDRAGILNVASMSWRANNPTQSIEAAIQDKTPPDVGALYLAKSINYSSDMLRSEKAYVLLKSYLSTGGSVDSLLEYSSGFIDTRFLLWDASAHKFVVQSFN